MLPSVPQNVHLLGMVHDLKNNCEVAPVAFINMIIRRALKKVKDDSDDVNVLEAFKTCREIFDSIPKMFAQCIKREIL